MRLSYSMDISRWWQVYTTSIELLTLEVYDQHITLYDQLEV